MKSRIIIAVLATAALGLGGWTFVLRSERNALKDQLAASTDSAAQAEKISGEAIDILTGKLGKVQEEKSHLEAERTELQSQVADLGRERSRLSAALDEEQKKVQTLTGTVSSLTGDRDGLQSKLTSMQEAKTGLEGKLASLQKTHDGLEAEHTALKEGVLAEMSKIREYHATIDEELRTTREKLFEVDKQIAEDEKLITALEQKCKEFGVQMGQIEKWLAERRAYEQQRNDEIAKLQGQVLQQDQYISQVRKHLKMAPVAKVSDTAPATVAKK